MPATPTDIFQIDRPDVTVFLAWRGTPGLQDMDPFLKSGSSTVEVMHGLSGIKLEDPGQFIKLQHFLSGPPNLPTSTAVIRYDGAHAHDPVLATLHHHLKSGRLHGVVAKRFHRREHAPPRAIPTPAVAATSPASQPQAAPAAVAAFPSTRSERIEALFRATVPHLKGDLHDELRHLLTVGGLAETIAMTVAFTAVMTAAQFVPVAGATLDVVLAGLIVLYAGWKGIGAFWKLMDAARKASDAHSQADIEAVAPQAAKAIETLGSAFLLAFGARYRGRSPDTAGGTPAGAEAPADVVPSAQDTLGTSPYPGAAKGAEAASLEGSEASAAAEGGANRPEGGIDGEENASSVQDAEPVNVASGAVFTEHTDFVIPGTQPLVFERRWISTSTINGDLGFGWHHSLDMALLPRPNHRLALRLADGRFVVMDDPTPGRPSHDAVERMQLCRRGDDVVAVDHAGRTYRFGESLGPMKMRRLMEIADGNGNSIRLERERWGGLVSITDSAGRVLQVARDGQGRILSIDGPHPDGDGRRLVLASFEYDRNGDLAIARNAVGAAFRYAYERHLLVRMQRPAGLSYQWRYNDTALRHRARCVQTWGNGGILDRRFDYDDIARRTTIRSGRGGVVTHDWNAQGRVTATVDALGRRSTRTFAPDGKLLLAETRPDGVSRQWVYDGHGRLLESIGFDGATTRVAYAPPDAEGLVTGLPLLVEEPDGGVSTFEWDPRGNLASHTDPAGRVRRFVREERGLTLVIRDAIGTLRRFGWGADGLIAWEAAGEDGSRIRYGYDALGRLAEEQAGTDAPVRYLTDALGHVTEVHRGGGNPVRIERDAEGSVVRHVSAIGQETRWRYDGLPFPVERTDADGTRLRYRYDADLNLVELVNQKDERYVLELDEAAQVVSETGFDGRRRTYHYDSVGFLASHADAEERGASYRRDAVGRLLERRHADGSTDRYAYDAAGRVVLGANGWGEIGLAFGPDGALTEERGPAGAIRHGYDGRGRHVSTTLPDGRTIALVWNGGGGAASVAFDGRQVAAFERDGLGRETGRQAGGFRTESVYDPQGRLVRQSGRAAVAGGAEVDRRYAWDAADRLTELVDLERGVRRYAYDTRSRLVGVDGDLPERFEFDPASNIVASSADDRVGAPGLAVGDRLLIRGDRKFEYDGCGNRVREIRGAGGGVERLYRYRADNQLAEVEERSRLGRRVTSFDYDAFGRRTEKRSRTWGPEAANDGGSSLPASDTGTRFLWAGAVLVAEGTASDSSATVYLHEPHTFRPLAMVRRTSPGATAAVFHYHLDHLGTPQEVSNDDGRAVWRAHYRAWGAVAHTAVMEIPQPIRFLGQYEDTETGLFYNRNRYYAPEDGRYVHQDPIRLQGGSNLSAYVRNPTGWTDAFGLMPAPTGPPVDPATGSIDYGSLDSLGRPTGVNATITQDMLGTGSDASQAIRPPGWMGNGRLFNQARGHLLANMLGGSGSDARNLVTMQQNGANNPVMRDFEARVFQAVRGGQTVNYTSTPIYQGSYLVPRAVTLTGTGSDGYNLGVSILNPTHGAPGFTGN